jgi:signal transduction histidine kinase
MGRNSLDIFSHSIESGCFRELNEITGALILDDSSQGQKNEKFFDLLSSFSLRILVPLNIESNLRGGIGLGDKLSGDPYSLDDQELLVTMAHQGAVAIENAKLHQAQIESLEQSKRELEQLNKAKSRALDHLSHELRTPLSVIQGNIRILKRKTQTQTPPVVREEFFESLEKNLCRLSDIQQETDKIIRSYQEMERRPRLEELDLRKSESIEPISLYPFAERILGKVKKEASHRVIQITLEGIKDLVLDTDPRILEEMFIGLLKNAIENTPDEGMIRIVLEQKSQWIQLKVMDFGIGITKENHRHLFDGLFHTLDTDLYSSKKPYDFGAGGKGLDLLRMKVYSQRFGFDISVASQRCLYLPTDSDLCPGKISKCSHCKKSEDCLSSGGSTFCLSFLMTTPSSHSI